MKDLLALIAVVLLIVIGVFGASELGYRVYQRYAPLNEQVRRETYEQSRAFQEGTVRDLENLRMDYASGNDAQKAAIRSVAIHRLADVPQELLTPSLRQWANEMRNN